MKKIFIFALVILAIATLVSCEKEEDQKISIPSPALAKMGTEVPDTVPYREGIVQFLNFIQKCRRDNSGSMIYYDHEVSKMNSLFDPDITLDQVYYVTSNGKKCFGTSYHWIKTVSSMEELIDFFKKNLAYHEEMTGRIAGQRFWQYDLFGMQISKYPSNDPCHAEQYRISFLAWVAIP